jgi:hypothetical protein
MKSFKKSIVALGISVSFFTVVNGQDVPTAKVPAVVRTAFSKDHPGIKASWERESGNYEAGYMNGKLENSVFYTPEGKMVKYETGIEPSQIPAAATDYIKKNFPGKKIEETAKVTTAAGKISYLVVIKGTGKATMFDSNGNYLETAKD